MLYIQKIDHVGIRIREKQCSIAFYEDLGFELIVDTGFEKGHPIMMQHPSGVVLSLLGPSSESKDENIPDGCRDTLHGIHTHGPKDRIPGGRRGLFRGARYRDQRGLRRYSYPTRQAIAGTGIQPCQVFGGHSYPWYSNRDAAAANPGRTPQMIMYSHSDPSQNPSIKSSPRKSRSRAGSHHANR